MLSAVYIYAPSLVPVMILVWGLTTLPNTLSISHLRTTLKVTQSVFHETEEDRGQNASIGYRAAVLLTKKYSV